MLRDKRMIVVDESHSIRVSAQINCKTIDTVFQPRCLLFRIQNFTVSLSYHDENLEHAKKLYSDINFH